MSEQGVTRLLPGPIEDLPLAGLYLGEHITQRSVPGRTLIYTNFVASLDGRISVGGDAGAPAHGVPEQLANPRDWRLYQELAIQADAVITSGRYVREWARGVEGSIFTIDDDAALSDLRGWREQNDLTRSPATVVVSRLLRFDIDAAQSIGGDVVAFGSSSTDDARVEELAQHGIRTILGESPDGVTGDEIAVGLADLGYGTAFSAAGPRLAHLLMRDRVLNLLYITYVMKLLGGTTYDTLNEGALFKTPRSMELRSLYLDRGDAEPGTQLFAAFEAAR